MPEFTRTEHGLRNSHQFYSHPIVWVEGDDDVVYLGYALQDFEIFVKPANGKPNCEKLATDLFENDAPIVVVMDGDYDLLKKRKRKRHRRLIVLERYSIENYLFEEQVCEKVCRMCAADLAGTVYVDGLLEELNEHILDQLKEVIGLDAALCIAGEETAALPNRIEALLKYKGKTELDPVLVEKAASKARKAAAGLDVNSVHEQVRAFIQTRPIAHLLRGHLLFGLLRFLISQALQKNGKRKAPDDRSLRALFARYFWQDHHADHKKLRAKLIKGVRELKKRRLAGV